MFEAHIDVSELEAYLAETATAIDDGLDEAGLAAAREGVKAVKEDHPYTDRTGNLTGTANAERDYAQGGGVMVWPEDYAGYVDGKRSFNFTKHASDTASGMLRIYVERAIERIK